MARSELLLLAFFGLCWLSSMVITLTGFPLSGLLPLSLYALYGLAALGGWLCGNVMIWRRTGRSRAERRRMLIVYLVGPLGLLYLVHTLGAEDYRLLAPLAPLWAFAVFGVFFLVPVTFQRS